VARSKYAPQSGTPLLDGIAKAIVSGDGQGEQGRNVVLVPYMNGPLLGDKLLLSAVFQWLRLSFPYMEIWALDDGRCTLSMEDFVNRPDRVIRASLDQLPEIAYSGRVQTVVSFTDHNSDCIASGHYPRRKPICVDMWAAAAELASIGIVPEVKIPWDARERADRVGRNYALGSAKEYCVIHIRSLDRESLKNGDIALFSELARRLSTVLSLSCFVVGKGDMRDRISGPQVYDLLYNGPMSWKDTLALLHCARLFVGTDSGPLHLAAACGTRLVCLDYRNSRFGPFCPETQVLGRFPPLVSARDGLISAVLSAAGSLFARDDCKSQSPTSSREDNSSIVDAPTRAGEQSSDIGRQTQI
jgi:hypothetical protein